MILPNPLRLVLAAARTIWFRLRGYEVLVTSHVQAARMEVCRGCEEYDDDFGQCRRCTCFLDAKTWLAAEDCPKNKWLSVRKRRSNA